MMKTIALLAGLLVPTFLISVATTSAAMAPVQEVATTSRLNDRARETPVPWVMIAQSKPTEEKKEKPEDDKKTKPKGDKKEKPKEEEEEELGEDDC
jgi:hypothetical protein